MGTEKQLTALLVRQITEGGGISPAGLRSTGGTPNHKALARCVGYGWGLAVPQDREEGRERVLEFLEDQKRGHMAFGHTSEFGTSSHFAWWQNALAGIWKLAEREGDEEVLAGVRGWWVRELSVESLCATPEGKVVMPGARTHVVRGYADQRKQRDVGRAVILGEAEALGMRIPRDVRTGSPSLDRVGLWILGSQLPAAELRRVAVAPAELPVLLDTLTVQRSAAGHVAWFDRFTGLCPSFFAWAEYGTGEERYGARSDWRKSRPGGARPAGLPVPAVPGEVTETVVIQGVRSLEGNGSSGAMEAPELAKGSRMNRKDGMENGVPAGLELELPEGGESSLRRPPRRPPGLDLEEILMVHDPEEPLKSERVEEALKAMPEWDLTHEGQAVTHVKELPTPEVASLYTAYVTGLGGALGLPVTVNVLEGLVVTTLYARGRGSCRGGLTESVLDFARQIG